MENGYWVHKAPIGYKYVKMKRRGKVLMPSEPLASVIVEAFQGYATGRFQSQAEVKRFFEAEPTFPRNKQGEIKQQRVTDILTNPIYTGHICSQTYGIHWLDGGHEALISMATFDKVQARRKEAAKAPARKVIADDFALRGFATCASCNAPLRSSWSKGNTKMYPYYLCQTKGCPDYGKSIRRQEIEDAYGEIVKSLQPTEAHATLTHAMFRYAWDLRGNQVKDMAKAAKQKLADTDRQIETLLERIIGAGHASVIKAYEAKIADLERGKQKLLQNLKTIGAPKGTFEEMLELSFAFLTNPWKLWQTGDITVRRTVLRLAFEDRIPYCRSEGPRAHPH